VCLTASLNELQNGRKTGIFDGRTVNPEGVVEEKHQGDAEKDIFPVQKLA
jgi:hypothetical protein